ncbi:MAG: hypothetical protein J2P15_19640 [Micromonosporaceae bacterium]|nr:hypothetical protein [Micromonosporaceae bacterium]
MTMDRWAQWLLTRRDGNSATLRARNAPDLAQVDAPARPIADWETLQRVAPNPLVPTYGEAIAAALTGDERERLDAYLTAFVAAGTPTRSTMATAFLRALRP